MSTTRPPRPVSPPPLVEGQRLGRAEFHRRYEAMTPGIRAELVGGVVAMPSPLRRDHGRMTPLLAAWLSLYARGVQGLEVQENATILLDDAAEPQPDLALRIDESRGGRSRVVEGDYVAGPPELVVEVAGSTRRLDLGPKLEDYRRSGVLEYLVVALDPAEVAWHVRRGERLEPAPPAADGIHRSECFPGLWLDPGALSRLDLDALMATTERGRGTPEFAAFVVRLSAGQAGD